MVKVALGWRAGDRDCHIPRHLFLHVTQPDRQPGDRAENLDAIVIEQAAGLGDLEDIGLAVDQPPAKPGLDPRQRIAQGRLFQAQPFGRGRDAAFLDDHHEGAQQVPVQIPGQPLGLMLLQLVFAHRRHPALRRWWVAKGTA